MKKLIYLLLVLLIAANAWLARYYVRVCDENRPQTWCGWLVRKEYVPVIVEHEI